MSSLYLSHFGLEKPPFQITPDIDFFFSGSRRGDILTALLHVASHEEGIVTAVAEVGSGKTLLARLMISRLPEKISTVYLANPCFSRDEIISAIARDLGLCNLPPSIEEKLSCLHQELLRRHGEGERVLLVIDEAHAMPAESLEEVRLLSNLETSHHKLINIILFGQPELDTLLSDPRLRQVRDRVIHRFELPPLPRNEGSAYIDHRLRTAGWHGGNLLTSAATHLLLNASGGRARRINLLADKSLLAAYAEGKQQVDVQHVKSAISELQADPATTPKARIAWLQVVPASVALALLMTGAALWVINRPPPITAPPAKLAAAPVKPNIEKPTVAITAGPPPSLPAATFATKEAPAAAKNAAPKPDLAAKVRDAFERTAEKLSQPDTRGYTLQLTSLPSESAPTEYFSFIERHIDFPMVFAHNRTYKGKIHVAVYLGHYETEREARTALNNLPKPLKTDQPIVRTWAGIRREAQP